MKQPISSTALILVTATVLAASSYHMNKYCIAAIPIGRIGCKLISTVPQTIAMKYVLIRREIILAYILKKTLGYA